MAFSASSFIWTTSVLYVIHSHGSSASMALAHRAYLQPRRRIEAVDETNAPFIDVLHSQVHHRMVSAKAHGVLVGLLGARN